MTGSLAAGFAGAAVATRAAGAPVVGAPAGATGLPWAGDADWFRAQAAGRGVGRGVGRGAGRGGAATCVGGALVAGRGAWAEAAPAAGTAL